MVTGGLLSLLWIVLTVRDIRSQKMENVGTLSAFALAIGFQLGQGADGMYLVNVIVCIAIAIAIYSTGLIGGGDAKLLFSVLAWRPALETWMVVLVCLAVVGGITLVWARLSHREKRRWPLGGAISLSGLVVVWCALCC